VPPVSVFCVGERRLRAERNVQEIDAVLGAETGHRAGECGRLIEHQLAPEPVKVMLPESGVPISRISHR
jgi:hypothetical protein